MQSTYAFLMALCKALCGWKMREVVFSASHGSLDMHAPGHLEKATELERWVLVAVSQWLEPQASD